MADTLVNDETIKDPLEADDEFYVNAVGNLNRKGTISGIRITESQVTDLNPFTAADETKLDGIETAATADQTDAEIKTAYENNADTNEFSDAEQTNLGNQSNTNTGDEVAASATVSGIAELATIAEVDTGTDTVRTITPAGLAGSALQTKVDGIEALADVTDTTNVNAASATVLGTIATGVWNGTTIAIANGGTGQTTAQAAIDSLSAVSGATNEHVLTKDTGTGNAVFKVASSGFSDPMDTRGDIIYKDSGGTTTNLAAGTIGQVLTSDGTDIAWDDSTGGGLSNIVEDTAPQLGGDLDGNGFDINLDAGFLLTFDTGTQAQKVVGDAGGLTHTVPTGDTHDFIVNATTTLALSETAAAVTGNITVSGTVDGVDIAAEETRLANTSGTNTGDEVAASLTVAGVVELATIAETDTGTDATRAVTPDGLQGSALQTKVDGIEALADVTDLTNVNAAAATTVGTIDTGTWQGTTIAVNQGGTGTTTSTGTTNVVLSGSPTIVTPTIVSLTNAQHDHADAAGGGQIAASTALSDFANLALVAGDVYTGVHDFGGATSLEVPNGAAPTVDAAGEIAVDTTITDHTGAIKYHDGVEEIQVIGVPLDKITVTDGNVIAYNAANNEFEMVAAGAADNLGDHTATEIIKSVTFGLQGENTGQTIIGTDASNAWTYNVPTGDTHSFTINAVEELEIGPTTINAPTATFQENGVDISPIGIHDIWVGATGMWPTTTAPCSDLTKTELGTNDVDIQTLDFATGADEFAQFSLALPRNFDNSTITFEVHWTAASGSGTVSWDVAALARSEGDALDAAFTDETTVNDTLTTADDLHISPTSADMGLTGHVDGDYIHFRVRRDVTDDTLGVDAKLLGIQFHITTDAATSA